MFRKLTNPRAITTLLFAIGLAALILVTIQTVAAKETTKKAWLGVRIQELTPSLREAMKLGDKTGLLITDVVEGSPADDANLRDEDVIIEFDGKAVERADEFTKLVRATEPAKEIKVVVMRDGVRKEIMVTLAERKKSKTSSFAWSGAPGQFFGSRPQLGVHVQELNADLAAYFNAKEDGGALVLRVIEDTPAEKAGLKAGDVITKIGDKGIADPEDLVNELADYEEDDEVAITYVRHGKIATAKATIEEAKDSDFHFFHAPGGDRERIKIRTFDDDGEGAVILDNLEPKPRTLEEKVRWQVPAPPALPKSIWLDHAII
jgi:S1-C subfamily serine protease